MFKLWVLRVCWKPVYPFFFEVSRAMKAWTLDSTWCSTSLSSKKGRPKVKIFPWTGQQIFIQLFRTTYPIPSAQVLRDLGLWPAAATTLRSYHLRATRKRIHLGSQFEAGLPWDGGTVARQDGIRCVVSSVESIASLMFRSVSPMDWVRFFELHLLKWISIY